MTGRIVTPEEARALYNQLHTPVRPVQVTIRDLAYTVEQQGQQIAAVLELHRYNADQFCPICVDDFGELLRVGECPTARALGVES